MTEVNVVAVPIRIMMLGRMVMSAQGFLMFRRNVFLRNRGAVTEAGLDIHSVTSDGAVTYKPPTKQKRASSLYNKTAREPARLLLYVEILHRPQAASDRLSCFAKLHLLPIQPGSFPIVPIRSRNRRAFPLRHWRVPRLAGGHFIITPQCMDKRAGCPSRGPRKVYRKNSRARQQVHNCQELYVCMYCRPIVRPSIRRSFMSAREDRQMSKSHLGVLRSNTIGETAESCFYNLVKPY